MLGSHYRSVESRLMVPTVLFVVAGMVIMGAWLVYNQSSSLSRFSTQVAKMAQNISAIQKKSLVQVAQDQMDAAKVGLRVKAETLGGLMAGLAATPIANFDFGVLDEYSRELCKDPDVVMTYFSSNESKIFTSFRNEKDPEVQKLVRGIARVSVQTVVDDLLKEADIRQYSTEIVHEGEILGKVFILVSQRIANEHTVQIKEKFSKIEFDVEEIITTLLSKIKAQIDSAISHSGKVGAVVAILCTLALVLALGVIIRNNVKPILRCADLAEQIADGDLGVEMEIVQEDEIGTLSKVLNQMVKSLLVMIKDMNASIQVLGKSSTDLFRVAEKMDKSVEVTVDKANMVAVSAEEMSTNMVSVASAMEESTTNIATVVDATHCMSDDISKIAIQTGDARKSAKNAVDQAIFASSQVEQLGKAAEEIGGIIGIIADISDKTNLLALNAAIEAANAGEAGRGFAVVANEVKSLSQQTAEATTEIGARLNEIQTATQATVESIKSISNAIQGVNNIVTTVDGAMGLQSTATSEVIYNLSQASIGLKEINTNINQFSMVTRQVSQDISEVNDSASQMVEFSAQVTQNANDLKGISGSLGDQVGKFRLSSR
jgi:methyl-accepting chemotaxis protein